MIAGTMKKQISFLDEIIVDNFAGGGGASTGIELATGRIVEIAINHDSDAILMHKTNHPHTRHYCENVWNIDPRKVCGGRKVGLAWFSPDCKHFSKAKGGKPVDKKIRGLAWITLRWAGTVRPRVIILENVEEFQTWGLVRNGRPVKSKAGQTFNKFITQLRALGYTVEWNQLVAADYGAPTTRKRFFLIARCDGKPIVWPEKTHAPIKSADVQSGRKKPWRAAAEIIDWTLPCPSIFATKAEIKENYGKSAVRPLADNTLRRIIRGVDKFVIKSATPFILQCKFTNKPRDSDKPLGTITSVNSHLLCSPVIAPVFMANNENAAGTSPTEPIGTITTGGHHMEIAAELTASGIIQYHTEKQGYVRGQEVVNPIMTVDTANRYGLVGASLIKYYGSGDHGQDITAPAHTVTTKDRLSLAAVSLMEYHGMSLGQDATAPVPTTLSKEHTSLSLASLIKFKGTNLGAEVTSPIPTITAGGTHQGAVITIIAKAHPGTPFKNWSKIRELLNRYCGYKLAEDEVLLLSISGDWYFISDIGLRMLTPRELYSANGFPMDYIIDMDYKGNPYSKGKQVARCGNAVPPPFAAAIVRANLPEWCDVEITTMQELKDAISA